MTTETHAKSDSGSYSFKAEIQQLLNILAHSLYTDREIFLRELISNASDALNRIQFEMLTNRDVVDADVELAIHIKADKEGRTIVVSDSGIGMTRDEISQDLGTIAHSGAAAFLQQLEQDKRPSVEMIGQFGIGFYSVFMVAEEVKVTSRSYRPEAQAVKWLSDGGTSYELDGADKPDRGTQVEIRLKEDAVEFADTWRLEQIVRKHSDFVAFPIYVGDNQAPVNRQTALWRQHPQNVKEEQYRDFYRHLTLDPRDPLLSTHLTSDVPADIRSILYIPSRRERGLLSLRTDHGLKLYIRNVLIEENNKDLLPPYFRFVEGVVESEDLPLNISRETVQRSPAARRVQRALVHKLVQELESLSEERPESYETFWNEFGQFIKEGLATDPTAKNDLVPLLRFYSTKSGGNPASLADYVARMVDGQHAIYYVLGDDLGSVATSPHLDYFKEYSIEVLYLVDPVDIFMLAALKDYEGKPLENVDSAGLELPQKAEGEGSREPADLGAGAIPEVEFNQLVGRFVKVLGDRVLEVRESKVLKHSPCRLVSSADDPMRGMSRVYRLLNQDSEIPADLRSTRILEVNRTHPIMANLANLISYKPEAKVIDRVIEQLFENQLLMEGLHPNPAQMIPRIHDLLEAATIQMPG